MLCPQHMLCEMVSFSTSKPSWNIQSHSKCYPEEPHSFIPSSDFFVCWCWSGFAAFSTPPTLTPKHTLTHRNHQGKKKKKRMKRPSHWLTTDPWLSFENLRFQIKLSGLKGQRCRSPALGHSMSPASLEGLTCIFLSCQGRVMGAKENRGVQRSSHSQIQSLWNT